jgi:hypothetical protein
MSHFDQQLKATLGGSIDVNGYSIIGKPEETPNGAGGDLDLVGGAAASTQVLSQSQQQDRYTGLGDFGTFVGGDGVGGTAYVAADTITLSDGSLITVGSVDGNGDVLTFIVTTTGDTTITTGVTLTQSSTSGTGAGFTLTPEIDNVTGSAGGHVILIPGAGAGSGDAGEIQLAGVLNTFSFNITSPEKTNATPRPLNIVAGLTRNDETVGNDVNITAGDTNATITTGVGGDVNITSGGFVGQDANDTGAVNTATAGNINIVGASLPDQTASEYAGYGGGVNITGGSVPEGDYAYGGDMKVQAGDAYSTGGASHGGTIQIISGSGWDFSGEIILQAGGNDAGGAASGHGAVYIQSSAPSAYGVSGPRVTELRFMGLQSNTTTSGSGRILDNFIGLKAPDNIGTGEFTLTLPATDSTGEQALVSDGSGTLSWTTIPAAGISNIVEDTTPQLGGQLDTNDFAISNYGSVGVTIKTDDNSGAFNNRVDGAINILGGAGADDAAYGSAINIIAGGQEYNSYLGAYVNIVGGASPLGGGHVNITGGDTVAGNSSIVEISQPGNVNITGGAQNYGASTNDGNYGGNVVIYGGSNTNGYYGGSVYVEGGPGGDYGGYADVRGATGTSTNPPSSVTIRGGFTGVGGNYNAGDATIGGGFGRDELDGGNVNVLGGSGVFFGGAGNTGNGGNVLIKSGNGASGTASPGGDPGTVTIEGGVGLIGDHDGGDIIMTPGAGVGTGDDGAINITQTTAPGTTANKLYNIGGALTWNAIDLTAGGGISKFAQDNTTTVAAEVFNHALGTTDVIVQVFDLTVSPKELMIPSTVAITDANNVTVTLAIAPSSSGDYRVVITG